MKIKQKVFKTKNKRKKVLEIKIRIERDSYLSITEFLKLAENLQQL